MYFTCVNTIIASHWKKKCIIFVLSNKMSKKKRCIMTLIKGSREFEVLFIKLQDKD